MRVPAAWLLATQQFRVGSCRAQMLCVATVRGDGGGGQSCWLQTGYACHAPDGLLAGVPYQWLQHTWAGECVAHLGDMAPLPALLKQRTCRSKYHTDMYILCLHAHRLLNRLLPKCVASPVDLLLVCERRAGSVRGLQQCVLRAALVPMLMHVIRNRMHFLWSEGTSSVLSRLSP
jgi:hypothetical protein